MFKNRFNFKKRVFIFSVLRNGLNAWTTESKIHILGMICTKGKMLYILKGFLVALYVIHLCFKVYFEEKTLKTIHFDEV